MAHGVYTQTTGGAAYALSPLIPCCLPPYPSPAYPTHAARGFREALIILVVLLYIFPTPL